MKDEGVCHMLTSINATERGGRGFRLIQEKGKKMEDGVGYRIYFNKRPWKKRWRGNRFIHSSIPNPRAWVRHFCYLGNMEGSVFHKL